MMRDARLKKLYCLLHTSNCYFFSLTMQMLTSVREVHMVAIIIAVMFPDLISVHVKEDFDSVMTSRRV